MHHKLIRKLITEQARGIYLYQSSIVTICLSCTTSEIACVYELRATWCWLLTTLKTIQFNKNRKSS